MLRLMGLCAGAEGTTLSPPALWPAPGSSSRPQEWGDVRIGPRAHGRALAPRRPQGPHPSLLSTVQGEPVGGTVMLLPGGGGKKALESGDREEPGASGTDLHKVGSPTLLAEVLGGSIGVGAFS